MKSDSVKKGIQRAPHRSLLRACGLDDDDFKKPFIGIANSFTDIVPGHIHLRELVEFVKEGIVAAGGIPFEFDTMAVCDGISMNHEGMKYSLPSREIIAATVESMTKGHAFDGLVLIPEDKIRQVLDPLPVGRIWGVGRRMNEQLENLGIQTIGQLYRADAHRLQQYVGENMARHLQQLAAGIDYRIVAPRERAKSIGKEMTFTEDLQCREDAERVLLDLSCKVGWRLRKAGEKARTIQLKLRLSSGFKTYTRSRTLSEATCYDEEIYHTVLALFHELRIFRGIRLLGVSTAGFDDGRELNLFQDEGKKENLYAAIDKIRAKFGEGGITKAQLLCKDKRK